MQNVVITDTSVLIILQKIGEIELLYRNYGQILTTSAVAKEFGDPLPDWIVIQEVEDEKYLKYLQTQIDAGEASAFALAAQFSDPLILLDDRKARILAQNLNLRSVGVLGILIQSKQDGLLQTIKPLIYKIKETNFHISDQLVNYALQVCQEI